MRISRPPKTDNHFGSAHAGKFTTAWANSAALCGFYFVMVDTRIAPRYRVDKRAIAEYGGDKYSCTVRDISATGAAIEFPDPVSVLPFAKGFNLIIKEDGLKLACRIVWRRDYRIGVAFN